MIENDKQDFINETLLQNSKEIKGLLSSLSDKMDVFGQTVATHNEKLTTHEDSLKALHMKLWDTNTKLFWWVIGMIATLSVTAISAIIAIIKITT